MACLFFIKDTIAVKELANIFAMLTKRNSFIILFLVVFAATLYFANKDDAIETNEIVIATIYEDTIDKISIDNLQGSIMFKKQQNDWVLEQNDFPVDRQKLGELLQFLNFTKVKREITRNANEYARYFVESLEDNAVSRKQENGRRLRIWQKDKLALDVLLGSVVNSPERVRYFRYSDQKGVYAASIGEAPNLDANFDYWIDKSIYHFNKKDLSSLELIKEKQKELFSIKDNKFSASKKAVNETVLNDIFTKISSINFDKPIAKQGDLSLDFSSVVNFSDGTNLTLKLLKKPKKAENQAMFYLEYVVTNASPRWQQALNLAQQWHFQIKESDYSAITNLDFATLYQDKDNQAKEKSSK